MKVIKRNDSEQDFCLDKIIKAVKKANASVEDPSACLDDESIAKVVATVQKKLEGFTSIKVEDIQDLVERSLVRHNKYAVAKAYILYRDQHKKNKLYNETEQKVLSLINGTSDLRGDNANKKIDDNGAISDYIAGITTKSINDKLIPKDVTTAHKNGLLHWHDSDYSPLRPLHNCDVLNVEDMLQNGFMMGTTKIEPNNETPFRTICNLLSQISLIVSGRQYGGQTITWSHVLPFIGYTRDIIKDSTLKDMRKIGVIKDVEI